MRSRLNNKAFVRVSGSFAVALLLCLFIVFLLAMNGLAAGDIARHSTAADGSQGNGDSAGACSSGDGRYIAFQSAATNLVASDTNGFQDIFLKDTQTGAITRVSTDSTDTQATGGASSHCDISSDGKFVAFESDATNLVAGDTNAVSDIFLKDTQTGTTTRVSTDTGDINQADGASHFPSISADGRYVAFYSAAINLVAGDDNGLVDVFFKDTGAGTPTTRVSTTSAGAQAATGDSIDPSISGDGSLVAFASDADNLVPGDVNLKTDVFVKNTLTSTITRVSTSQADAEGNGKSYSPSISDGRYVAFVTEASNLLPSDANGGVADVVVKDTQTKTVSLAAADNSGTQVGSESRLPSISADGRRVAFETVSGNLYSGDADDGSLDIFTKDMLTGAVYFMPINSSGDKGNANSQGASISGDGSKVAFASLATNLVSGDTNNFSDVFSASPLVTDATTAQTTTTTLTTITQMTTTQMTTTGSGATTSAQTSKTTSLPKTGGELLTIAGMVAVLMLGGGVAVHLANRRTNRS